MSFEGEQQKRIKKKMERRVWKSITYECSIISQIFGAAYFVCREDSLTPIFSVFCRVMENS